jgi:hypothetical protein
MILFNRMENNEEFMKARVSNISSFYLSMFIVSCIIFAVILHLGVVNNIFFQNHWFSFLLVISPFLISLFLNKNIKSSFGEKIRPLIINITGLNQNKISIIENRREEQSVILKRLESTKLRKSIIIFFIFLLILGFVALNFFFLK